MNTAAPLANSPLERGAQRAGCVTTRAIIFALAFAVLAGCREKSAAANVTAVTAETKAVSAASASSEVKSSRLQIIRTYPHDPTAFTQGLIYLKGVLFETTGLNGRSTLRKVDLATGRVLQIANLPSQFFGEGMTVLNDRIYQVTWQNQKAFVYNLSTFAVEQEFSFTGEGWGLTTNGRELILSDGTHVLRFLDSKTFRVLRTISVYDRGSPLRHLNELEYIKGEIYANVWQTNTIARIDPATGNLLGTIDCSGLLTPEDLRGRPDAVLNGIAYDEATDRIFLTGKFWPKLFEVQVKP